MKSLILHILFLLFFLPLNLSSQELVTLNRDKLKKEKTERVSRQQKASRKTTANLQRQKTTRSNSRKTKRHQRQTQQRKEASYLTVNHQNTNVTAYLTNEGSTRSFYVDTDGRDYSISMLPQWCHVTYKCSTFFTISYNSNDSHDDRTDWFLVKSDNKEIRTYLNQSGKPISITASFTSPTVYHNTYLYGKQYMQVDATIRIAGAKGLKLLAVANVLDENGNMIYATSSYSNHKLNNGVFYAATEFTPNYEDYNTYNVTIYIPNNAMMLTKKRNKLTCILSLYCDKTKEYIENANYYILFKAKCKKGQVTTEARK